MSTTEHCDLNYNIKLSNITFNTKHSRSKELILQEVDLTTTNRLKIIKVPSLKYMQYVLMSLCIKISKFLYLSCTIVYQGLHFPLKVHEC